jgi:non-ribosomal peptide synthetase component F
MTLVAGFTVLPHRYTGQDDILAGSPMFGGEVAEDEGWVSEWIKTP